MQLTRKLLLLILLFISPLSLFAQSSNTTGRFLNGLAAARPTCSSNSFDTNAHNADLYNDTDDGNVWKCFGGLWSAFGGGGSSAFANITSGTNITAAMLVGTGASLGPTGGGTVTANVFSGVLTTANIPGGTFCSAGNYANGVNAGLVPSCVLIYYQTIQSNAVSIAQEQKWNAVPPFQCVDNGANTRSDCSIPVAIGVGGSHASGLVPDPGASGTASDYLGRDMAYHTSSSANTIKPDPSAGIIYVATTCNGGTACSDSNDGLSWGTAKLSPYAALLALPGGSASPPTAGYGVVHVSSDPINGIQFNPAGTQYGWWMFGPTDPGYAGGVTGWMRAPANGLTVTLKCDSPTAGGTHSYGAACLEFWGGHADNTHPAVWFSGFSNQAILDGFHFNFEATGIKIGIDSTNNRSTTGGNSSVLFVDDAVNLGSCYTGIGAGPSVDIGGQTFWIKFLRGSYSGCTTQDYSISAISRTSNVVTVTLNRSGTGDITAGTSAQIIIRNVTDKTFNGVFTIASASGTSVTYNQNGPNASSSGGQAFPYGAAAIGINSGNGNGSGFIYVDETAVSGGGIWAQGGSNGVGLTVNELKYEGSGTPDMSTVELVPIASGGDSFVNINDVQIADNIVPICGVESLGAPFIVGNASAQNTQVCGTITTPNNESFGLIPSPIRTGTLGLNGGHLFANDDTGRRLFSPYAARFSNVIGPSSGWTTTGLTVTTGILAPDGTTGATRLANTSGGTVLMNFGGFFGPTPTLGSYYPFGVWLRVVSGTAAYQLGPNISFNLNSSGLGAGDYCAGSYFSGTGASAVTANVAAPNISGDGEWEWFSGVCKIIANPSAGNQRFDMNIANNVTLDVYGPVMGTVAAGTMSDNEVWTLTNNLQSYPSTGAGVAAGDVAMMPGQRFAMAVPGSTSSMYFHTGTPTTNRTITWPDFTGTVGMFTGAKTNNDCVNWVVSGGVTTLGDAGAACGSGGGGNVTNALLNSFTIYTGAGTTNQIGGVPGPITPASVPQFVIYTPNGTVSGAPTTALGGVPGRTVVGASDTIVATDRTGRIKYTNAGATAISLPGAGTTGFTNNLCFRIKVQGASASDTITPASGTINGASSLIMLQGQAGLICTFDNSNYEADIFESGGLVAGTNITFGRSDFGGLTINSTAGGGTVTHTAGALTSGQLIFGNAAGDIKVGDLTGDATTSGTSAVTVVKINGTAFSGTQNDVVAFGAANTPFDTGVLYTNLVTAAAAYTNGDLIQAAASNRTTSDSGIATANVVTAASNSGFATQLCAAVSTNKACAWTSLTDVSSTGYAGTATGAVNVLAACPTNTGTALVTGMESWFLPNLANTSTAPTYKLCALTAKTITKHGTAVLANNDLTTIAIAKVIYDGTGWELQNPQTEGGAGSTSISNLLAASASNTIANVNFPQTWNWAQTTNSQAAMTFGETSAATNGTVTSNLANQSEVTISTASASTATPLSISQGSVTGSVAFPAFQIATTWNNGASTFKGIIFKLTNTASNAPSRMEEFFNGTTSEWSLDAFGNVAQNGNLLASGIVDGKAPVTVTTGASATLGGTYDSGYTFNQNATAATAITYTLPTAAAGLQYCVGNSYNGTAATTGTLEILTSAAGQFIIFTDGTLSATGGFVQSGGAAADAACVVGVDSTHWQLYVNRGTWTKH